MPMDIRVLDITPELAQQLLSQLAPYQRKIDPRHVQRLESDLQSGRWIPNGAPIRFDCNGNLLDGQHRLLGCVRSGVTLRDQVVVGDLPEDAYGTVDTNVRTRTAMQIAKQRGAVVSRTCIAVVGLEHYNFDASTYEYSSTPTERVELWLGLAEPLQQQVRKFEGALRVHRHLHRGAVAAALRCSRTDARAYEFFLTAFSNDVECPPQGRVLFNALARWHTNKRDEQVLIAWQAMRAFLAFIRREPIHVLRPPADWPNDGRTVSGMAAQLPPLRNSDARHTA